MRMISTATLLLSLAATAAMADCKSELAGVAANMKSVGPYHVDMTMTSGGQTMKMSGDVILPSSFHMSGPRGEMIKTADGIWMKMSGAWQPMPAQVAKMIQSPIDQGLARGMKDVTNLTCLGPQAVNGKTLTGYEFDSAGTFGGVKAASHVKLYADPATGLPAYLVVDGKAMGRASTTTQTITYDPKITIKAPM